MYGIGKSAACAHCYGLDQPLDFDAAERHIFFRLEKVNYHARLVVQEENERPNSLFNPMLNLKTEEWHIIDWCQRLGDTWHRRLEARPEPSRQDQHFHGVTRPDRILFLVLAMGDRGKLYLSCRWGRPVLGDPGSGVTKDGLDLFEKACAVLKTWQVRMLDTRFRGLEEGVDQPSQSRFDVGWFCGNR